MKRHSAGKNTDMRKRTKPEVARPIGLLTEEEIEDIRQAYLDGCRGEAIIGLRGKERVITVLVPPQPDSVSFTDNRAALKDRLRELGCDRFIRIRNALTRVALC